MNVSGRKTLNASPERVWPLIFDPNSLITLVPGCQQLEQVAPGEYRGHLRIGFAAVSGKYDLLVKVIEAEAPNHCTFEGQMTGPTGTIKGQASFSLQAVDKDTSIEYQAQAIITGALGSISPRILESIAKTLLNQGMAELNKNLINED